MSVYVNEVEMDRAREKIGGIEKDALASINDTGFDIDALFKKAVNANSGMNVNYDSCHLELVELFKMKSSTGGITIEKDF